MDEDFHNRNVSNRYFDALLNIHAGARLVELKVYPDAKELTESFAAFRAALRFREFFPLGDPEVNLVVVGDGKTPATATTFALQTRWKCHSVDPRLRPDSRWDSVPRLNLHINPIEEVSFEADRLVMVAVHAHVDARVIRSPTGSGTLARLHPLLRPGGARSPTRRRI